MALWQFAMNPIPASEAKICGVDAVKINRNVVNEGRLYLPHNEQPALFQAFAALLPEQPAWSEELRIWGNEKGNDIQVFFEGTGIECIQFRLDVSCLSLPLVDGICALACKFGWVFISKSGAIVPPTREAVIKAIEHSPAQRFVRDPLGYLASAASDSVSEQPN